MDKILKKDFSILGLDPEEAVVMKAIKEGRSYKVTQIAEITALPRTTVHFLLNKLAERGLAKRIKVKNHKEWALNQGEVILKKLDSLKNFFSFNNISAIQRIGTPDLEITVIKGKEGIKKAYDEMLKVGKNERVYFIQGS